MKKLIVICLIAGCTHSFAQEATTAIPKGKSEIEVTVTIGNDSSNDDEILYSTRHKLTLEDFKGKPNNSSARILAKTNSGLFMNYQWQTKGPVTTSLKIIVTTTFDKYKSWCKKEGRNDYILNHEQRHFDITAIKACAFINALKTYPFTRQHCREELIVLFERFQKEAAQEQQDYDQQTNHSIIKEQQEAWDKKLDQELKEQNCY